MLDRVFKIEYYNNSNIGVTKATLRYDGFGNICRVGDGETGKVYLYDYGTDGVLHYAVVIHSDGTQQIMYAAQDESGNTTKTFTGIGAGQSVASSYTYSQGDNQLTSGSVTYKNGSLSSTNNFTYGYDSLQRLNQKSYTALVGSGTRTMTQTYGYRTISSGVNGVRTSNQVSSLTWKYTGVSDLAFAYTYDAMGNISTVKKNGVLIASYEYDEQGQLIRETLPQLDCEYNYVYDTVGNLAIVEKVNLSTFMAEEVSFSYDSIWKDKLTSFNGNTITYDDSGNPLVYNNGASYTFTWNSARNLTSVVKGGVTTTYQYNQNGLRTKKQYGSTTYQYYYDGDKLLRQTWGSNYMDFLYDESGEIYSLIYNGTQYYYVRNLQGDVVQIRSIYGTAVVEYTYDAWGNVLSITGQYAGSLGQNNPIRYRGYYYDSETGFYYLQSRYYDPAIRRFISADDPEMLGANGTFVGYNLYAYCDNNPVNYSDPSGHLAIITSMAIGAAFGILVQYLVDVVINMIMGAENIFLPYSSAIDYAAAALGGALAVTGIGKWGAVLFNTISSTATYILNCMISKTAINFFDILITAGIGAVVGLIGGSGANLSNNVGIIGTSRTKLLTMVSPQKIMMYTNKIANASKQIISGAIRTMIAGITANLSSPVRKALKKLIA